MAEWLGKHTLCQNYFRNDRKQKESGIIGQILKLITPAKKFSQRI